MCLNHKKPLRLSIPEFAAALTMDSTDQEEQGLAGWGRGAAGGTGTELQSCPSAQSPTLQRSLTPGGRKLAAGSAQAEAVNPRLKAPWECGNRAGR